LEHIIARGCNSTLIPKARLLLYSVIAYCEEVVQCRRKFILNVI
jgi:hypothetical protein